MAKILKAAAVVTVACVIVGVRVALIMQRDKAAENNANNQAAMERVAKATEEAKREIESGTKSRVEIAEKQVSMMEGEAAKASGETASVLKLGASLGRSLAEQARPFEVVFEKFKAAGGVEPSSIMNRELIDARLTMLAELSKTHGDLVAYLRGFPDETIRRAKSQGMSATEARSFSAGFMRGAHYEELMAARAATAELLTACTEQVKFMKDKIGTWAYDRPTRIIVWDTQEDLDDFVAIRDRVVRLVLEEDRLTKQVTGSK